MSETVIWANLAPNERDALIAQHVFGRKIVKWRERRTLLMEREGRPGLHESVPAYTESMDEAWKVLQAMAKHEDRSRFMHLLDKGDLASKSNLEFQLWEILIHITTWTPEMICLAALRALGLVIDTDTERTVEEVQVKRAKVDMS
jgi:hypothetical protein